MSFGSFSNQRTNEVCSKSKGFLTKVFLSSFLKDLSRAFLTMADVSVFEDIFNENPEPAEETFDEIKKNLLDEFETATTVINTSKVCGEREPVKVYLRVRPFTSKEIIAGESQGCLEIVNSSCVLMHPPKTSFTFKHQSRSTISAETVHRFSFSRVFGPDTSQKSFFEDTSFNVVKDFIDGQNCLVFSYGVTNAGKTYTILGNGKNAGVLPRTINILFNSFKEQNYAHSNLKPRMFCDVVKLSSIQEEREESKKNLLLSLIDLPTYHNSVSSTDLSLQDMSQEQSSIKDLSSILDATSVNVDFQGPIQFSVWISFAEIYNENIYDLLEPISLGKNGKRTVLKVGDDRKGNPYIKGLTEIHVNNAEEALQLLKIGRKNQKIASTKLNENSSRSHCIFTLKILRVVNTKEPHVARVSRLSFVDLAGSERYTKTHNTGERLKEAGNINTSIMTLGKCVALLRYNQNHVNDPKREPKNIPFRESKLTRLFQGFFCGKGKASMIVNVNQCASAFDETLYALKFSAIAKKVTTMVQAPQPDTRDPRVLARSTRTSVAWADGSLSTPACNKVQTELDETQLAPLAEEEKTDIQEHTCEELQAVIDILKAQLTGEKKNMILLELKIREEVCQEMSEQMVEIENDCNERLLESQRMNEDLYEQRMDLLTKSVKKSRKRPRVDCIQDDDDEWISSRLLQQEKMKVQEMISKIDDLEQKMKEMEDQELKENESFKKELCERDEKIESLQRIVKDCKVELETKTTQLMSAKKVQGGRRETPTKTTENYLLKQLEKRIEETTRALDKKNSQVIDKNNIIVRLEKSLKDAKEDVQERERELSELRVMQEMLSNEKKDENENEREIKQLNVQLKEKESELIAKTKENDEVLENLKFVEGEVEILTSKDKETQDGLVKLRQREDESKKQMDEYEQLKLNLQKQLEEKENVLKDTKTEAEELNHSNELKEQELLRREAKIKELTEIIDGLKADFDKALVDLANVQATVELRNQKLEYFQSLDKSLKDACRAKECEIMQLRKDFDNARKELQDKDKDLSQLKDEMEKRIREEILKVNVNWECATERMKIGLEEQEDVLAQMEKTLAMKENEITDLRQESEQLNKIFEEKKASEEALSKEKEHFEDQIERLKIKVFQLETEVVKLQKEVKKQTTKKDSATQALKDGLEIVKTKKIEYETRMESIKKEKDEMKRIHEELKKEIERLKSASSESSDEKSAPENNSTSSHVDNVYKPVEVESFNLPTNDRVEIDVTPITGSGLLKSEKKTGSVKAKLLKRNSMDLSLKELKAEWSAKSKKRNNDNSEDDFTPVSVTKLRKTRNSSVSGRGHQSKANMLSSPFSLSVLNEDLENTNPLVATNSKKPTSGKRRIFNKFGISENGKSQTARKDLVLSTLPAKKRRGKLLKKSQISAPLTESPLSQMDKTEILGPVSRAQELVTRHLRSRVVKSAR